MNLVKLQDRKYTVTFLYTNTERSGREMKQTISFTIPSKRVKCPELNLPMKVKNLYSVNHKTLMKEIEDDTKRSKDIACS